MPTEWTTSNAYSAKYKRLVDFRGKNVVVSLYPDGFAIAFYEPDGPRMPERWERMDAGTLARVMNDYGVSENA